MKSRSKPELDALETGIRHWGEKNIAEPIKRGARKAKIHKAIAHVADAGRAVVNPSMLRTERKRWAADVGEAGIEMMGNSPHLALAHAPFSPPGTGAAAEVIERGKNWFLNNTPGVPVAKRSRPRTPSLSYGFEPAMAKAASVDKLLEALKDPTVRKVIALAAGVMVLKHITEKSDEELRQQGDGFAGSVLLKHAEVSPYQQKTQHTCSAACLKAVLEHYGSEADEHDLSGIIGLRQRGGAETDQIASAARKLGFECFEYSFDSLDQARTLTDQDIPIIADIQSFNHPGSGHYVVITAIDDESVHLMDPNTPGNQRTLSREEMDARWWDRAMKPPHAVMQRWGVIVVPPEETA